MIEKPTELLHTETDFRLDSGACLPVARVAAITLGRLNAERSNAVLVTHGYTSSHGFVLPDSSAAEGSWGELVGPGKPIDTDRFFVVSSNALGSCYGSTGPGSAQAEGDRPYGPDFPEIGFADIVRLQRRLLDALGVRRLHAVAGVSMGGFQALQWSVQYPDAVERAVVALSALDGRSFRTGASDPLERALQADPAWRDGRPLPGAMVPLLCQLRVATLSRYGMADWLKNQGASEEACQAQLLALADAWAHGHDVHALRVLRDAMARFDVRDRLAGVRARVLLVLSSSDALFPASEGPAMLAQLLAHRVDARFHELKSPYGHLASGIDAGLWQEELRAFMR